MLYYIPDDFPNMPLLRVFAEYGYSVADWHSSIAGQKVIIVSRNDDVPVRTAEAIAPEESFQ